MMITLTPRIYDKDIKWSLLPSNKVDTVVMNPLVNSIPAEDKTLYSADFTECTVSGQSRTLPIPDTVNATHWRYMSNTRWTGIGSGFSDTNLAKARMECVWATGKSVVTVDQAITGTPTVELQLVGTSSVVERGGSTFENYPSIEELSTKSFSSASWIESNKTTTNNTLSGIYENLVVSMNPWIRRVVPAVIEGDSLTSMRIPTTDNDVITNWFDSTANRNSATADKWSETNSFGNDVAMFDMFPANATGSDLLEVYATCIRMRNLTLNMSCSIKKLSDYTFEVSWEAPVRLSYIAAARSLGPLGGKYDIDNFAFVDKITNVVVNLKGRPYDSSTVDIKYGMDAESNLTTFAPELHPLRIEKSEALTLGSFDQSVFGTELYLTPWRYTLETGLRWLTTGEVTSASDHTALTPEIEVTPGACYKLPNFSGFLLFFDAEGKNGIHMDYDYSKDVFFKIPSGRPLLGITYRKLVNTFDGIYETYPWTRQLSQMILARRLYGKYVVECTVPATWAIEQDLKINSLVEVVLPNGQYFSRSGNSCYFEVKNIKKIFKNVSFTFQLKLIEV